MEPVRQLTELFRSRFGRAPAATYRAPGRVNLIGEHTDYNDGLVLPVAIGLECRVAAAPNDRSELRARAEDLGEDAAWPLHSIPGARARGGWTDYVLGVAQKLGCPVPALDLLISSTVPVGGGLSSSAALEVAVALALLDGRAIEPLELALLCHRAENEVVGLPCGVMDQFVAVFAEEGSALLIDCRDRSRRTVKIPRGLTILAVNSMVKHELASSAYAVRVGECREAARRMGIASLREVAIEQWRGLDGVHLKRARHVVSENQRVDSFVDACAANDPVRLGHLMAASHHSLQRDYEVSCAELDFLVAAASRVEGVLGARMTGGGFGGCTVNLMLPSAEERFRERIAWSYRENFGRDPEFHVCCPSAGASALGRRG